MSSGQGLCAPCEQSHSCAQITVRVGNAAASGLSYEGSCFHVQACKLHNNVSCIWLTHGQPLDGGLGVADDMGGTAAQVSTPHNLTPTCLDSLMHTACTMGSSAYQHQQSFHLRHLLQQ